MWFMDDPSLVVSFVILILQEGQKAPLVLSPAFVSKNKWEEMKKKKVAWDSFWSCNVKTNHIIDAYRDREQ